MKSPLIAIVALLLPAAAGAAPHLDGIAVRERGPVIEFLASGRLGSVSPAELADPDRLVQRLPADVALPAAARSPGAFRSGKTFPLLAGGAIARLEQQIAGIPVDGVTLAARVDGKGELRWTAGHAVDPTRAASAVPALAVREAVERANALSRVPSANRDRARLVYLPMGDAVALAYRIDLPAQPGKKLDAPTVWIDAHDGSLLRRVNRLRFQQARVWEENPVSTPDLITVTLPDLDENQNQLKGKWVEARNCVDDHETVMVSYGGTSYSVHVCTERAKAVADENGDFFFDPILGVSDAAGNSDDFSEAHAYHHVSRAYAYFRELGLDQVNTTPLPTTVNYRYAYGSDDAQDPYGQLHPFDNAFFLPAGQGVMGEDRPYDSIVFGQGTDVDFAYDGGVLYHEFTHAVVNATADLGFSVLDDHGLDGAPGAMNEGYADYFANAMAGDPVIGEYAGGSDGIRTAENDATCPGSLIGETHQDSKVWAGALWDIRKLLGVDDATSHRVDQAIYNGLIGLPSDASFLTAAEVTIEEIGLLFDESAAAEARSAFEARNLLGCNNRVIDIAVSGDFGRRYMYLGYGYQAGGYDPTPSYLQFRIVAEDPIVELAAQIGYIWSNQDYPAAVYAVAKVGEPIVFTRPYGRKVKGNWDYEVAFTGTSEKYGTSNAIATFETPIPAGPVYFALLNRGVDEATIASFKIEWAEGSVDPGTGGTGGTGGSGGAGGAGGSDLDREDSGGGGSSGCSHAGGPTAAGVLAAAVSLLVVRRRRP